MTTSCARRSRETLPHVRPHPHPDLNGLASASSLFLVASGLSIIFGVTRIVNFAHGSLYMLGAYVAWTLVTWLGPADALGFWGGVVLAALVIGLVGVVVEVLVLRRIYQAPELFQLLATFGVVLMLQDLTLATWGAEDKLGPRAPGFKSFVVLFDNRFPTYELFLIAIGPLVLLILWLLFQKTRWGVLVRAATQDREMVGALGVNQRLLFTSVFFFGSVLAGLGGALQLPREAVNLHMDLSMISEALRGRGRRRSRQRHRGLSRRRADRHPARLRHPDLPQDHAGPGLPGHGGGARGQALWADGQAPGRPRPRPWPGRAAGPCLPMAPPKSPGSSRSCCWRSRRWSRRTISS